MIAFMTIEKWLQSERFYYVILPILMVVGLIALLGFLMVLLYRENRNPKVTLLLGGIVVACLLGFFIGDQVYGEFKTYNALITPNIRDREKMFLGYKYYESDTTAVYQRIQSNEAIETLGIYQAVSVERAIEFLGSAHNSVYFKMGAQVYYARYQPTFVEEETTAKLQGVQYHLTDPSFETIGFYSETNNYLTAITIPKTQETLEYQSVDSVIPKEFGKSQTQWALPNRNE
ncbi:hypothetical protein [Enterococcus casseliflavus]|uniref:hypothetical protein n=1 Tax=Enterococcus TaxID=1350 RepID=UPI002259F5E2|nr:hypothetical protein [Enterococcus casseliflavus]MCX4167598.1 hypothetical protein [Enterococcus casseliflavus]MDV7700733.1 hypothetical protein [Enterococcus casseliflavus]